MVTVELAIGFVTVTLLTATMVGLVMLGVAQAACARASTEVARQLARGDAAAAGRAEREAPEDAVVRVDRQEEGVRVEVTAPVPVFGMGSLVVGAQAWSRWEPGVEE